MEVIEKPCSINDEDVMKPGSFLRQDAQCVVKDKPDDDKSEVPTLAPMKRQCEEIEFRLNRLSNRKNNFLNNQMSSSKEMPPPKARQCQSEISQLMKQLQTHSAGQFTKEVHLSKDDPNYGRPQEGTQTAARGKKAHQHISGEIVELCEIIWSHGHMSGNTDGDVTGILFGDLFDLYTRISSKVVGLLLRARKYGLVEFEGETLFQGRDEKTPVYLVRTLGEVRAVFRAGQDPSNFEWGKLGVKGE